MDLCLMIEGQEGVSWEGWLQVADPRTLASEPPQGWVVGTVEQAAEQLAALKDAGVRRVMCQQLIHDDLDAVALLGIELAPRLS